MNLLLVRKYKKADYTIGKLYIENRQGDWIAFCDTMEPPVVGNRKHPKGAIPEGVYEVRMTWSNKFRRILPLVCEVPGFEGIRIHSGNTVKNTTGCILVGQNTAVGKLTGSRKALSELKDMLYQFEDEGEVIELKIKN